MTKKSDKADRFFHFKMIVEGHTTEVAVWNGIKDYSNPPDKLMESCWGRVVVRQIGSTKACLDAPQLMISIGPTAEFLIFWTRDDDLYQSAVQSLKLSATHKRNPDGSISSERVGPMQ